MSSRPSLDPYGGRNPLVDRMIGDVYPNVKLVADHLPYIIYLAQNFANLRPKDVEFNSNDDLKTVQWRYVGETEWRELLSYSDITGPTLEMQEADGFVQWRPVGAEDWVNLVPISEISGREVEMRQSGNYLEWRYVDETAWAPLWDISQLIAAANSAEQAEDFASAASLAATQADISAQLATSAAAAKYVVGTYAELVLITSAAVNEGAQVFNDPGTHVDPVSSATVSNTGQYRWTGTAWQWLRVDLVALKLDASVANPRIIEFQHRDIFVPGQLEGPYLLTNITPVSTPIPEVTPEGGLRIPAFTASSSIPHLFWTGQRRFKDSNFFSYVEATVETLQNSPSGPTIGFGDNQTLYRGVMYTNSGNLALLDGNQAGVISISSASMAFVPGERVRLEVHSNPAGGGYALATKLSTGATLRLELPDGSLPVGKVWVVIRRSNPTLFHNFYARHSNDMGKREIVSTVAQSGFPLAPGFDPSVVPMIRTVTTDAEFSGIARSIDENGYLNLVASAGQGGTVQYVDLPFARNAEGIWEYEIETELSVLGTSASGSILVIGNVAGDYTIYAVMSNGFFGRLSSLSGSAGVPNEFDVLPELIFDIAVPAKLRLYARPDGTGTLTAEVNGVVRSREVSGIPNVGQVRAGWRSTAAGKVRKLTGVAVSSTLDRAVSNGTGGGPSLPSSPQLLNWHLLPDGDTGRNPKGFTCTGRAIMPITGKFARCVVAGDDGRLFESDLSSYKPRLHIMDGESRAIIKTINPGYINASLQGVGASALDPDKVWIATSSNRYVRKIDLNTGFEDLSAAFNWPASGLSSQPNGLTCDDKRGGCWVSPAVGNTIHLISYNGALGERVIDNRVLGVAGTGGSDSPDHLHYVPEWDAIVYSLGANGTNGQLRVYYLQTGVDVSWGTLPGAQAIEGITVDVYSNTVEVFCDGGYHIAAKPALNIVMRYLMPKLA